MEVKTTHHIDAGDKDSQGRYQYYYEYDVFCFTDGEIALTVRSYVDSEKEAHFLRLESAGQSRMLSDSDLAHPLFAESVCYLQKIGKEEIKWLSGRGNGYEPVMRED